MSTQLRRLHRGGLALPDERLVIRDEAEPTPTPYVAGTLLAVRAAAQRAGLVRDLDPLRLDQ